MSEDKTSPETPSTAVIFQAPEPAAPRRASAPAGPPNPSTTADAPAGSGQGGSRRGRKAADSSDGAAPKKKSGGRAKSAKSAPTKAEASDGSDKSNNSGKGNDGGQPDNAPQADTASPSDKAAKSDDAAQSDNAGKSGGSGKSRNSGKNDDGDSAGSDAKSGDQSSHKGDQGSGDGGDADGDGEGGKRRRRRGGRGRGKKRNDGDGSSDGDASDDSQGGDQGESSDRSGSDDQDGDDDGDGSSRRRRRRRGSRSSGGSGSGSGSNSGDKSGNDDQLQGSTRLQAKRQRRRDNRDGQRRRPTISEAEFLARRESVKRDMIVREKDHRVQIAVLEDEVLVEHYVSHQAQQSMAGNVYLARVQNVLPGMEAAFVDVGRGRNAVLYAGEVNWDAAGLEGKPRRIELALKPGDTVMVQVTKDPIGHKGARVTSQISLAGRFLVYVPAGGVTGISRKLPDNERARLKKLLREVIPADAGVIVRTAAEGASEEELRADVERLKRQWENIQAEAKSNKGPTLLRGEPDMAIRVVRDIFNEDFESLTIQGDDTWNSLSAYVGQVAPDLLPRLQKYTGDGDLFAELRVDEMLTKGMDRKVWLPSGGSLVIDRTEAMTVIDVNTGKFVGKGGTLEETMTLNNLEAAEEIVRQLRLRDIGGIIVIDFVDMLLEGNRDRVLRRLIECLGRDRTKHQVAEVTSLGLVQMTRKRVGQGLVEAFSETCEHCKGRGFLVKGEPVAEATEKQPDKRRGGRGGGRTSKKQSGNDDHSHGQSKGETHALDDRDEARAAVKATLASIAAAAEKAHHHDSDEGAADGTHDSAGAGEGAEGQSPEAPVIDLPERTEGAEASAKTHDSPSDAPDADATGGEDHQTEPSDGDAQR
ncbi:Rne/Rng family ribonuclease [Demequina sp. SO4-18]|uniref:Rne/Rng family ribonuclease n=1 Tax=Demequina sp. SO4-18 TaxID=3401026 RepID=UPI003B5A6873